MGELAFNLQQRNLKILSTAERRLLEIILICGIHRELIKIFENQYRDYYQLIKDHIDKEDKMIEAKFLQLIIKDIIASEEYTLEGISNILNIPLDTIIEIASGINENPSFNLSLKIFNLHHSIRKDFYSKVIDKVIEDNKS